MVKAQSRTQGDRRWPPSGTRHCLIGLCLRKSQMPCPGPVTPTGNRAWGLEWQYSGNSTGLALDWPRFIPQHSIKYLEHRDRSKPWALLSVQKETKKVKWASLGQRKILCAVLPLREPGWITEFGITEFSNLSKIEKGVCEWSHSTAS